VALEERVEARELWPGGQLVVRHEAPFRNTPESVLIY